jgi:hypothetical protein
LKQSVPITAWALAEFQQIDSEPGKPRHLVLKRPSADQAVVEQLLQVNVRRDLKIKVETIYPSGGSEA